MKKNTLNSYLKYLLENNVSYHLKFILIIARLKIYNVENTPHLSNHDLLIF